MRVLGCALSGRTFAAGCGIAVLGMVQGIAPVGAQDGLPEQTECYVLTKDGVKYGRRLGLDIETGRQCRPIAPELLERLRAYEAGRRPARVDERTPTFFDPRSGEPVLWYAKSGSGEIELFDLMGFHPVTGEELLPVTREAADSWNRQIARRVPKQVDPDAYDLFDPLTGKTRAWYARNLSGQHVFYDAPGFDPRTGDALQPVDREFLQSWKAERVKSTEIRCFVLTSDPRQPVKYGRTPGLDAQTGRECRPATADLLERLREYEKGRLPKRVEAEAPVFFDLRNGESALWFAKLPSGRIELFDLMGFHPETGMELLPVSREVASAWRTQRDNEQRSRAARPPQSVDPSRFAFFDPVSGDARVWYWRSPTGDYEFFDAPGYHARTGDALLLASREFVGRWTEERATAERARKQELERREAEVRLRREQDEKRRQEEATRQAEAQRTAQEAERRRYGIIDDCDRLAGNPNDLRRNHVGATYDTLRLQAAEATEVCRRAVQEFPSEQRLQYQLARALQVTDRTAAYDHFDRLVRQQYPAAYDNFGWLHITLRSDFRTAVNLFLAGARLNDPDSMLSLAEMVDRGHFVPPNPIEAKLALLRRSSELGNAQAKRAFDIESAKYSVAEGAPVMAPNERQILQLLGTILQGAPR